MKTLIIDATGRKKDKSNTKYLATKILQKLKLGEFEVLDLYQQSVPYATEQMYEAIKSNDSSNSVNKLVCQFEEADQYIFIYPTWNWSVPAILKAYIDLVVVSGRTFGYNQDNEKVGYLDDKKAILISTTGGATYEAITATIKGEQSGDNYMKQILQTLGIDDITTYSIDNMAYNFNDESNKFSKELYYSYVDSYVQKI